MEKIYREFRIKGIMIGATLGGGLLFFWLLDRILLNYTMRKRDLAILGMFTAKPEMSDIERAYAMVSPKMEYVAAGREALVQAGIGRAGLNLLGREGMGGYSILLLLFAILAYQGLVFVYLIYRKHKLDELADVFRHANGEGNSGKTEYPSSSGLVQYVKEQWCHIQDCLIAEKDKSEKMQETMGKSMEDLLHQLKTPLAGISLIQEWLLEYEEDSEKKELLENCGEKIDVINTMVMNYLYDAKFNASMAKIHLKRQSIQPMLRDIQWMMQELLEKKQLNFVICGEEDTMAQFDSFWVKEALQNLLKNAAEHSKAGQIITLEVIADETLLDFYVKDQGAGIDIEQQDFIFQRFASWNGTEKESTGIGLNLAWEIAHRHGGMLELLQHEGEGTWFRLRIPQLTGKNNSGNGSI